MIGLRPGPNQPVHQGGFFGGVGLGLGGFKTPHAEGLIVVLVKDPDLVEVLAEKKPFQLASRLPFAGPSQGVQELVGPNDLQSLPSHQLTWFGRHKPR